MCHTSAVSGDMMDRIKRRDGGNTGGFWPALHQRGKRIACPGLAS